MWFCACTYKYSVFTHLGPVLSYSRMASRSARRRVRNLDDSPAPPPSKRLRLIPRARPLDLKPPLTRADLGDTPSSTSASLFTFTHDLHTALPSIPALEQLTHAQSYAAAGRFTGKESRALPPPTGQSTDTASATKKPHSGKVCTNAM